jgi:hypothetical protein
VDYRTTIETNGLEVTTLADVLPDKGPMRMLVVGKAPAVSSVELGHHLQGTQGKLFWRRLEEYEILPCCEDGYHDDILLDHGFGITHIAALPRKSGDEPTSDEYRAGWDKVDAIVQRLRPRIVTFVYKGALDRVLRLNYGWQHSSTYGFNQDLMRTFGRRVFAFPLPGTPCTVREARRAMEDLKKALTVE